MALKPDAILIAGPTASGKTSHALEMAKRYDGEIINADSMQVYPVLRVLTARPDDEELAQAHHHLYGHADIRKPYSVAQWAEDASPMFEDIRKRGKVSIFVGGTGLYFRALLDGLSPVPKIPQDVREDIRNSLIRDGANVLHERLKQLDPESAGRLKPGDSHRIARALEVVVATGTPISVYHSENTGLGLLHDLHVEKHLILPDRSLLHERIHKRADLMIKLGAVEEVKALLELNLPAQEATVLKAIGVQQISDYIQGNQTLDQALDALKTATRQYAKRQSTWFRNQFDADWKKI